MRCRLNDQERAAELLERAPKCTLTIVSRRPTVIYRSLERPKDEKEAARRGGGTGRTRTVRTLPRTLALPVSRRHCILAEVGEIERAKEWAARALAIDPDDPHAQYNAACMWAQVGEPDKAFEALEIWSRIASRDLLEWIKHDPDMDPLRNDPRYQRLVERIDLEGRQVVEPPMEIPT